MEVIRTLKPGQHGTRRFQKHWGESLVNSALVFKTQIHGSAAYRAY